jgi:hypothetical protein
MSCVSVNVVLVDRTLEDVFSGTEIHDIAKKFIKVDAKNLMGG